ncbi:MAG: alpha/beta hydrolase [Spirulinaceae cyanobacterium]
MNFFSTKFAPLTENSKLTHQKITFPKATSRSWTKWGIALINLGFLLTTPNLLADRALSAERIYVSYGILDFSISVEALETYAREGKIEQELTTYAGYLNEKQLIQLRQVLQTRADLDAVAVAQFFYTPQGEIILQRVGKVIQTQARQSGFYALRSALILAAADEEGLTPLNILKKFPTVGIRINSRSGFQILDQLSSTIKLTQQAVSDIEIQGRESALANPITNLPNLRDLRESGTTKFTVERLNLRDNQRLRIFPVDLYLPQNSKETSPLIVISHGLGSNLNSFRYVALHLASHGFAVAALEHPGSNSAQVGALLAGLANEVSPPQELIDRPLDIKYLLDVLEQSYSNKINLERIGILGQSYGAYTSLALAGADINREQVRADCQSDSNVDFLNISLLLQCQAIYLEDANYELKDDRIAAVIAINPLDSTIFGETEIGKIEQPIMIFGSSDDTVTPVLVEQIMPFTWLTSPPKYLALLKGGTHFSAIAEDEGSIPLPPEAVGPDPKIAQEYVKALSLAFFSTYIGQLPEYQDYLTSSYALSISKEALPLILLDSLTLENQ